MSPLHRSASTASDVAAEKHAFKAETQKLLHIVANSLYSERDVFLRELVSNASDALEKLRHYRLTEVAASSESAVETQAHHPLEINVSLDKDAGTLTIEDNGIGMTLEELKENLGVIAKSGSKSFLESLDGNSSSAASRDSIIGQFGVGFYSAFMVGSRVDVYTRSARDTAGVVYRWSSDGLGEYTVTRVEDSMVMPKSGSRVVISLKSDSKEFTDKMRIEGLVKKHSNFIAYPVRVDGTAINTTPALWAQTPAGIEDAHYLNFYRFIADNSWDEPRFRLHYKIDAPVQISALLYVPGFNAEATRMERVETGVGLYSRKVLIQPQAKSILPDWLRFLKGAVDSEDIPLNLSRELLQDGLLVSKIRRVLTARVIKWLTEEAKRDAAKYARFFADFGIFIKEGVCVDTDNKDIAKLLRFESSLAETSEGVEEGVEEEPVQALTSLAEYASRQASDDAPDSKHIFYLLSRNRQYADESPYVEPFKQRGIEVLYMYDPRDEYVVQALSEWEGRSFVSVDSDEAIKFLAEQGETAKRDGESKELEPALSNDEVQSLGDKLRETYGLRVKDIRSVSHLTTHPAIVTGHASPARRQLMRALSGSNPAMANLPEAPVVLEINPRHRVIHGLATAYASRPEVAEMVAQQVLDNALIAAGVLDDPRSMLGRLNELLERVLETEEGKKVAAETVEETH